MTIPKKIRIKHNVSYRVVVKKNLSTKDTIGECDPNERVIYLKKGASHQSSTLLHEILHALEFEDGIKISHKSIYEMEGPLSRVLKLNKFLCD